MSELQYVYSLRNPLEEVVRYIGKTNDPSSRLRSHIDEGRKLKRKTHKTFWIKSLLDKGLKPQMEILEETTKESVDILEKNYIKFFRSIGAKLTNVLEGGSDSNTISRTHNHGYKISLANKGKKRPLISIAMKGRVFSEEHRKNLGKANSWRKGIKFSDKWKENLKKSSWKKRPVEALNIVTSEKIIFNSTRDADKFFKVGGGTISQRCTGRMKNIFNGFSFRYL